MMIRTIALTVGLALLAGCDSEKGESASGTASGSTSGTTDTGEGESSTGATPEPTTTAGQSTATEGGSSTSATSGATEGATEGSASATTGEETTTGAPVDAHCQQFCQRFVDCSLEPPESVAACRAACTEQQAALMGECLAAATASLECVAGMTCAELEASAGGDLGPCVDEAMKQHELCGSEGECSEVVGGNVEGTECSYSRECFGSPKFEMICDLESCDCFADGRLFTSCEPDGICAAELDLLAAAACCGF